MSARVACLNGLLIGGQTVLMAASVSLAFMIFIDAVKHHVPAGEAPASIDGYVEMVLSMPGA